MDRSVPSVASVGGEVGCAVFLAGPQQLVKIRKQFIQVLMATLPPYVAHCPFSTCKKLKVPPLVPRPHTSPVSASVQRTEDVPWGCT